MRILILSNSAPGYFRFFNRLASKLCDEQHHVEFAVDCPYTMEENCLNELGLPVNDFSSFFSLTQENCDLILNRYQDQPLNAALLSDFERADVYHFGRDRGTSYYRNLQAALLSFFEQILTRSSIDLVIYENVSNAFAHYAWIVCQKLKVPYCGLVGSRLPGRFSVVDGPFSEHYNYAPIVEAIRAGRRGVSSEVREWCADYLKNLERIVPDYMSFNNLDKINLAGRYLNGEKFSKLIRAWRHRHDEHQLAFQVGNPLALSWQMVWRNLRRKFKIPFCQRYYSEVQSGERFLLYPLHFHPESSTSILAGSYLDEYEVIRNIAFSLPAGMMLYVKDHVSAYAYPSVSFYRRLAALPNVRLISPFHNTKQLIRDSVAVITLTSTVGYEALLLNRRVFLYGSVFYEFHPNVVKINNPARLFELFREHVDAPLEAGPDYHEDFVAAYYLGTYAGVLNFFMDDARTAALVEDVLPQLRAVFTSRVAASNVGVA